MRQKGCYVPRDCEYKHIRRKVENRGRQEQDTKAGEGRAEFDITENAEEIRQHFKNKSQYLLVFFASIFTIYIIPFELPPQKIHEL